MSGREKLWKRLLLVIRKSKGLLQIVRRTWFLWENWSKINFSIVVYFLIATCNSNITTGTKKLLFLRKKVQIESLKVHGSFKPSATSKLCLTPRDKQPAVLAKKIVATNLSTSNRQSSKKQKPFFMSCRIWHSPINLSMRINSTSRGLSVRSDHLEVRYLRGR